MIRAGVWYSDKLDVIVLVHELAIDTEDIRAPWCHPVEWDWKDMHTFKMIFGDVVEPFYVGEFVWIGEL